MTGQADNHVVAVIASVLPTGPKDLRDQKWLNEQVSKAKDGFDAVVLIANNWTEGRNLSRLHLGVSAVDYVKREVGQLTRDAIAPLLVSTDWSNRQIAAVTGTSPTTVGTKAAQLSNSGQLTRPAKTTGADGRKRTTAPVVKTKVKAPGRTGRTAGRTLDLVSALMDQYHQRLHALDVEMNIADPGATFLRKEIVSLIKLSVQGQRQIVRDGKAAIAAAKTAP